MPLLLPPGLSQSSLDALSDFVSLEGLGASSLLDPSLLEPSLLEPSLLEPSLLEPSLLEPSLLDPSLLDPSLLELSLLDPSLLAGPESSFLRELPCPDGERWSVE